MKSFCPCILLSHLSLRPPEEMLSVSSSTFLGACLLADISGTYVRTFTCLHGPSHTPFHLCMITQIYTHTHTHTHSYTQVSPSQTPLNNVPHPLNSTLSSLPSTFTLSFTPRPSPSPLYLLISTIYLLSISHNLPSVLHYLLQGFLNFPLQCVPRDPPV